MGDGTAGTTGATSTDGGSSTGAGSSSDPSAATGAATSTGPDTGGGTQGVIDDGCICASIYEPVCGKDGKTYGNACAAACAGVEVRHAGECLGDCSGGNCLVAPQTPAAGWLLLLAAVMFLRGRRRAGARSGRYHHDR